MCVRPSVLVGVLLFAAGCLSCLSLFFAAGCLVCLPCICPSSSLQVALYASIGWLQVAVYVSLAIYVSVVYVCHSSCVYVLVYLRRAACMCEWCMRESFVLHVAVYVSRLFVARCVFMSCICV